MQRFQAVTRLTHKHSQISRSAHSAGFVYYLYPVNSGVCDIFLKSEVGVFRCYVFTFHIMLSGRVRLTRNLLVVSEKNAFFYRSTAVAIKAPCNCNSVSFAFVQGNVWNTRICADWKRDKELDVYQLYQEYIRTRTCNAGSLHYGHCGTAKFQVMWLQAHTDAWNAENIFGKLTSLIPLPARGYLPLITFMLVKSLSVLKKLLGNGGKLAFDHDMLQDAMMSHTSTCAWRVFIRNTGQTKLPHRWCYQKYLKHPWGPRRYNGPQTQKESSLPSFQLQS